MITKTVPTFTATIFVGLKNRETGRIMSSYRVIEHIQEYVDKIGYCVTITRTEFIYSNGSEPGLIVGLINYPRFPLEPKIIRQRAMEIAEMLLEICQQHKVSIVFPDETVMLSATEEL